jgi:3-oxoacyl-(acyl-carrier-protein) synthase
MSDRRRVVATGAGVVHAAVTGPSGALGGFLGSPRAVAGPVPTAVLGAGIGEDEARRLSKVSQLTLAAARLAVRDAGGALGDQPGLVVGTELGDLRSTIEFADGFLARGPSGLSPLLFPGTVMNTMAATTAIALATRGPSLTVNAADVAGELALWRAAAAIAAGRADAMLAGGVDEIEPFVGNVRAALGAAGGRGEGAAFLVLEPLARAAERGARILGEILGAASVALAARPHGVGRSAASSAVTRALARAGMAAGDVGWIYCSIGRDDRRARWERDLVWSSLAPSRPPATSLAPLVGHHSGLGVLHAAAAMWTARTGLLPVPDPDAPGGPVPLERVPAGPGLVHGVARGGAHVALVVGPPPAT